MLDAIFRPRAIAVIGASQRPRSIGWQLVDNILRGGFRGRLFPVNPAYEDVHSIKCWPSVAAIEDPVDLAVIAVPASDVLRVARECVDKGVRGLIVVSAGFAEVGGDGPERQAELVAMCREAGVRVVGPNCMGVVNTAPDVRMNATFARTVPRAGNVAFMSQSGALGEAILAHAASLDLGLSMFASVGNRADVSAVDFMEHWHADERTDVLLLYLESFGDPRRFVPLVRAITRDKPVVAVKAGRTPAGRRAVISHTGAMVGLDVTTDALFAQCGVLRAQTVTELFDVARALASQPLPKGRRVAIVTNAGGPGALAADALHAHGLELPALSEPTQASIRSEVLQHASVTNPVDLLAAADPRHYQVALEAVLAGEAVDAVIVIFVPPIITDTRGVLEAVAQARETAPDKPVLACVMGEGNEPEAEREALGARHIPIYAFPEPAAAALDAMARRAAWLARPPAEVRTYDDVQRQRAEALLAGAHLQRRRTLTPQESLGVLAAYGIPVVQSVTVASPNAARKAASDLGYPVALKVSSSLITHKSDVRGVILDIRDGDRLEDEMLRMHRELGGSDPDLGFAIQPMVTGGLELIAGMVTDPQFGPVVMFGLGGTWVETFKDVVFRLAPLTPEDAREMLAGLRGAALLDGARGRPGVDKDRVTDVLCRLSQLVVDFPEIDELDVNPLLAFDDAERFAAVDARIVLRQT